MKYFLFIFSFFSLEIYSQEIQDKIYIINDTCYIPQTDLKIAQLCFEFIDSLNPTMTTCHELPSGLLSIANNRIKYSFRKGELITTSFFEMGRNFIGGPTIIGAKPIKLQSLNTPEIGSFLETYQATLHGAFEEVIIDRSPLRKAMFKNDRRELMFDFAVDIENNLYCMIILRKHIESPKPHLEIWRMLSGNKELIHWASYPDRTDWSNAKSEAELLASLPLPEKMNDVTAFSLGKNLFIFNSSTGNFYQFHESGLQPVSVELESRDSYADFSLVIDKDNQAIFLLPKSVLQKEIKTFREIINLYGIKVLLSD